MPLCRLLKFMVAKIRNYGERKVTSYELQVTSYKLRVTSYELRVTSYKLRVTSYELRVTSYELQVTSYELQVTRNTKILFSAKICGQKKDRPSLDSLLF